VRVDLVREKLSFQKQAWIEFLGLTFFTIPYCLIVGYFATVFAWDSFQLMEKSASTVGLSYRFIIKSVLVFGMFTALLAGLAVWLQTVLVLLGPKELRFKLMTLEWPEDAAARGGRLTAGPGV
jgi:TRAP-type mannitol/chloroaromatic compound transport system permease small subunit